MFTRCRSLSTAEEIKVKQNKRERQSRSNRKARRVDKEGEGGEEGRNGERYRSCTTHSVKEALLGCEKCVIKVPLMFCCMVLLHTEDVHAQVHITQNILQMLHSQRQPTHRQAGCGTTPPLDLSMVTPLVRSTSMVTNTMKLMSCLTD